MLLSEGRARMRRVPDQCYSETELSIISFRCGRMISTLRSFPSAAPRSQHPSYRSCILYTPSEPLATTCTFSTRTDLHFWYTQRCGDDSSGSRCYANEEFYNEIQICSWNKDRQTMSPEYFRSPSAMARSQTLMQRICSYTRMTGYFWVPSRIASFLHYLHMFLVELIVLMQERINMQYSEKFVSYSHDSSGHKAPRVNTIRTCINAVKLEAYQFCCFGPAKSCTLPWESPIPIWPTHGMIHLKGRTY